MYVCMYVSMYVCVYTYIYIHICVHLQGGKNSVSSFGHFQSFWCFRKREKDREREAPREIERERACPIANPKIGDMSRC